MRRLLASLIVVLAISSPALACLNGWDTPGQEQEFRSQYGTKFASSPSTGPGYRTMYGVLLGAGFLGAVGAGVVTLRTRR